VEDAGVINEHDRLAASRHRCSSSESVCILGIAMEVHRQITGVVLITLLLPFVCS
jgi:hypothetical protein